MASSGRQHFEKCKLRPRHKWPESGALMHRPAACHPQPLGGAGELKGWCSEGR